MSDYEVTPAKLDRLKKGLEYRKLDTNLNNYHLIGEIGSGGNNSRLEKNIREQIIALEDLPPITHQCVCGQSIVKNCIIKHLTKNYILTIGSCCYKGMTIKEARMQLCSIDGCNERHQNKKYTVCAAHRDEMKRQQRQEKKEQRAAERAEMKRQEEIKRLGEKPFGFGRRFKSTPIKDIPDWFIEWLDKENIWNDRVKDLMYYRYWITQ